MSRNTNLDHPNPNTNPNPNPKDYRHFGMRTLRFQDTLGDECRLLGLGASNKIGQSSPHSLF